PAVFKYEPPSAFVRRYLADAASPTALVGSIQASVSGVSPAVMSNRVQLVRRSNVDAELERVRVPILYLQASRDRIVGDRGWNQIQAVQPTALHVELEGPHLLLQCAPQEASAAILDFVIRNEPPR
ncbi:MAG: hypothetical protein P1V35_16035, partial [Planctomycetota bacterium]|nr:hypothetical protein [Planctomycetota bacterium]